MLPLKNPTKGKPQAAEDGLTLEIEKNDNCDNPGNPSTFHPLNMWAVGLFSQLLIWGLYFLGYAITYSACRQGVELEEFILPRTCLLGFILLRHCLARAFIHYLSPNAEEISRWKKLLVQSILICGTLIALIIETRSVAGLIKSDDSTFDQILVGGGGNATQVKLGRRGRYYCKGDIVVPCIVTYLVPISSLLMDIFSYTVVFLVSDKINSLARRSTEKAKKTVGTTGKRLRNTVFLVFSVGATATSCFAYPYVSQITIDKVLVLFDVEQAEISRAILIVTSISLMMTMTFTLLSLLYSMCKKTDDGTISWFSKLSLSGCTFCWGLAAAIIALNLPRHSSDVSMTPEVKQMVKTIFALIFFGICFLECYSSSIVKKVGEQKEEDLMVTITDGRLYQSFLWAMYFFAYVTTYSRCGRGLEQESILRRTALLGFILLRYWLGQKCTVNTTQEERVATSGRSKVLVRSIQTFATVVVFIFERRSRAGLVKDDFSSVGHLAVGGNATLVEEEEGGRMRHHVGRSEFHIPCEKVYSLMSYALVYDILYYVGVGNLFCFLCQKTFFLVRSATDEGIGRGIRDTLFVLLTVGAIVRTCFVAYPMVSQVSTSDKLVALFDLEQTGIGEAALLTIFTFGILLFPIELSSPLDERTTRTTSWYFKLSSIGYYVCWIVSALVPFVQLQSDDKPIDVPIFLTYFILALIILSRPKRKEFDLEKLDKTSIAPLN